MLHVASFHGTANFLLLLAILMVLNAYVLNDVIHKFQNNFLPRLMNNYEKLLRWILKGKRPAWAFVSLFGLFFVSLGLLVASVMAGRTKFTFFPSGDPSFIYVYLKMPVGTDVKHTDSVLHLLEHRVEKVLDKDLPGKKNAIVESIITNVAANANNPRDNNRSVQSHLGRIQVSFVEFEKGMVKNWAIS